MILISTIQLESAEALKPTSIIYDRSNFTRAIMRLGLASSCVIALLALAPSRGSTATTLDIYFIDVEGGQSTLLIS